MLFSLKTRVSIVYRPKQNKISGYYIDLEDSLNVSISIFCHLPAIYFSDENYFMQMDSYFFTDKAEKVWRSL